MVRCVTQDYDTSMATAALPIWAPTPEKMQAAIERLVAAAQPTRIILFGSRARGDADVRSDVDLLVIKPRVENRYEELVELDRSLAGILMPVDILLVSEAEFEERAEHFREPVRSKNPANIGAREDAQPTQRRPPTGSRRPRWKAVG